MTSGSGFAPAHALIPDEALSRLGVTEGVLTPLAWQRAFLVGLHLAARST